MYIQMKISYITKKEKELSDTKTRKIYSLFANLADKITGGDAITFSDDDSVNLA